MTGLGQSFIRLVGRAASGLNNTFSMWCEICRRETTFKLISEVAGNEVYRCCSCNSMTKTYVVK